MCDLPELSSKPGSLKNKVMQQRTPKHNNNVQTHFFLSHSRAEYMLSFNTPRATLVQRVGGTQKKLHSSTLDLSNGYHLQARKTVGPSRQGGDCHTLKST